MGLDAILTHFSQEPEQTPYPTIKTHYRPSDSILGGLHTFSPTARCPKFFQPYSHCSENNQFSSRFTLDSFSCLCYYQFALWRRIYVQADNRFTSWWAYRAWRSLSHNRRSRQGRLSYPARIKLCRLFWSIKSIAEVVTAVCMLLQYAAELFAIM